jgi:hypothetical protein
MTSIKRSGRLLPDFFVIGAPKCGTTSVYSYLKEHSQIFMPSLKEPHYFSTDFPELAQVSEPEHYRRLFAKAAPDSVIGEASVWYSFSQAAVANILAVNPATKFILMLRNPVDAAAALHSQFLRSGKENVIEFEEAWHLQFERRRGRSLPAYCPEPRCLQYREVFSYAPQLERLLGAVPAQRIKVYVFEEMFCEPRAFYVDLLTFLEVDDDHRQLFEVENSNREFRARWIAELLASIPESARDRLGGIRTMMHAIGLRPAELLLPAATRPARRRPLQKEFRRYLSAEFASDVEKLEEILGRPMVLWRERDCFSAVSADTLADQQVRQVGGRPPPQHHRERHAEVEARALDEPPIGVAS